MPRMTPGSFRKETKEAFVSVPRCIAQKARLPENIAGRNSRSSRRIKGLETKRMNMRLPRMSAAFCVPRITGSVYTPSARSPSTSLKSLIGRQSV